MNNSKLLPKAQEQRQRPGLGEWCEINAIAHGYVQRRIKHWEASPCASFRAMYIGYRTVADGHVDNEGYDDPNYFVPTRYQETWLFIISPRKNPVHVFPVNCRQLIDHHAARSLKNEDDPPF